MEVFKRAIKPNRARLRNVFQVACDFRILGDMGSGKSLLATRWASATLPTFVMDGGRSPAWVRHAMQALAGVLPNAQYRTLDGQTHMLKPEAVTPVLEAHFAS
jgi:hypothetical protein